MTRAAGDVAVLEAAVRRGYLHNLPLKAVEADEPEAGGAGGKARVPDGYVRLEAARRLAADGTRPASATVPVLCARVGARAHPEARPTKRHGIRFKHAFGRRRRWQRVGPDGRADGRRPGQCGCGAEAPRAGRRAA